MKPRIFAAVHTFIALHPHLTFAQTVTRHAADMTDGTALTRRVVLTVPAGPEHTQTVFLETEFSSPDGPEFSDVSVGCCPRGTDARNWVAPAA